MVFDLGGGTFDLSIMQIKGSELKCVALNGSTHLGGNDFTQRMVDLTVQKYKKQTGEDISNDKKALSRIRDAMDNWKTYMSNM